MPNGDDKNWFRICHVVDEFRKKHRRWPVCVRMPPLYFEDVVGHVLSPIGFALVSTVFDIVADDGITADYPIIADGRRRGKLTAADRSQTSTMDYFGHAIFRADLE